MMAFAAGDEVIWRTIYSFSNDRHYGSIRKIAKVYKTGRFILEGDETRTQYVPINATVAKKAGDRFAGGVLLRFDDEAKKEIAEYNEKKFLRHRAEAVLEDIKKLSPRHLTAEEVQQLEAAIN